MDAIKDSRSAEVRRRPRSRREAAQRPRCGCGDVRLLRHRPDHVEPLRREPDRGDSGGSDARVARLRQPHRARGLKPGEIVLDLGSGGGIDVLLSARRVGPTGKAYGLDMTDEMLALARENQQKAGLTNVEFLKGEIEHIPLPDNSVDVIISNCVINLSADKDRVHRGGLPRAEARRPFRRLRRRRARRRRARSGSPQHGALGRLRRRRARGGAAIARSWPRAGFESSRRRADAHLPRGGRATVPRRRRALGRRRARADRRAFHERVRARAETRLDRTDVLRIDLLCIIAGSQRVSAGPASSS